MKKVTLVRIAPALIVLTLGGCKGSAPATAATATVPDPVFLLEAGEEPLALLRYQVAAGTTTASTLEFGLASLTESESGAELEVMPGVMLANARTTLGDVPLPAEPVGLGARWETRKTRVLYGVEIRQVNTYTLIGRVGDVLKLRVAMQQTALPQTLTFPEDGIEIVVDSFSANASGDIINNLHALSTEAHATGESASRLTVRSAEGTDKVSTSRMFEFRTTNTDVQIPSP